ncbi:hypothetical protein RSal33209_2292 [Renibacterium salmoninarum ATCC 33209]|uniref:Uncharacterized protein n=1 Tax=Renibacterium salmoninarum (strain ATCC 33209 / DSM 20767 / JCM 11484 / NBRC 15589 / NCIMB 2235) TaxID=288705 RepID=A9WT86_RENSM|nr:hypothetical protein RSal33209_2292 [Renibacterium salmoninarum ATCC 33209]
MRKTHSITLLPSTDSLRGRMIYPAIINSSPQSFPRKSETFIQDRDKIALQLSCVIFGKFAAQETLQRRNQQ